MNYQALFKDKLLLALGVIVLLCGIGGFVYYDMNKPEYGTWRYGLCRTFAELQIRFPSTMWITQVIEDPKYAELYVSYLNAHGVRPTRAYKCNYDFIDGRIHMTSVTVDFDQLSDEVVAKFDQTIPFLINDPDLNLELPPWEGMDIEHLRPDYLDRH